MVETGIDSALLDRIVREVVRRLRAEADSGEADAIGKCRCGQCKGREHCPRNAAERKAAGSSPCPEHETISLRGRVIVEEDIKRALAGGARSIRIDLRAIVTPLARDTAKEKGLAVERVDFGETGSRRSGIAGGRGSSGS